MSSHVGTLSIVVADGWRDVGIGSALVGAAQRWAREQGLLKVALAVFPDNDRAIAVYEHAGFVREGLRRKQYRADGDVLRDELLMAWFPDEGTVGHERHRPGARTAFDAWAGDYDRRPLPGRAVRGDRPAAADPAPAARGRPGGAPAAPRWPWPSWAGA